MTNKMPKLYLVFTISPVGLSNTQIVLKDEKPDPFSYTRGEGQCFVFKLSDFDCSTEFHKALLDKRFFNAYGNTFYNVDIK